MPGLSAPHLVWWAQLLSPRFKTKVQCVCKAWQSLARMGARTPSLCSDGLAASSGERGSSC